MSRFVLDNSVTMRWLLQSSKRSDQLYAERVLKSLLKAQAAVPHLWYMEIANVLLGAEKHQALATSEAESFLSQLEQLPIEVDPLTAQQTTGRILALSRAYKLNSYDAAYLELAARKRLPLATLDRSLRKAARKSGIELYRL